MIRISKTRAAGLGVVAGIGGAAYLYAALSSPVTVPASAATPMSTSAPVVVYRDCTPPAVLEGLECVTHVVTTVAAPAPDPAAVPVLPAVPAAPGAQGTPAAPAVPRHDDSDDRDRDSDSDDHGSDDHGDHNDDHDDD